MQKKKKKKNFYTAIFAVNIPSKNLLKFFFLIFLLKIFFESLKVFFSYMFNSSMKSLLSLSDFNGSFISKIILTAPSK